METRLYLTFRVALAFLVLRAAALLAQEGGCSTDSDRRWVAYGGGEIDLECSVGASDQRKWWVREEQEAGDCQWRLLDGCGANEHCEVGVDYSTTRNELEYCCTRDADPTASAANDVQCFSLGVCPEITSVTVPSPFFSGSQASVYFTLVTFPLSSLPDPSPALLLHKDNGRDSVHFETLAHTDFTNTTIAYSFTVPASGQIEIDFEAISVPDGSRCPLVSENVQRTHTVDIVEADGADHPSPTTTTTTTKTTTSTADTPVVQETTVAGCPAPSPSPSSSPSLSPASPSNLQCQEGVTVWMPVAAVALGLAGLLAVVITMVMCVWVRRLKTQLQDSARLLSDFTTSKSSSPDVEETGLIPSRFSHSLPPTSPPPPPPTHHIIEGDYSMSQGSGIVVTATPPHHPSSPDHISTSHSTPCHDTPYSTPHHSRPAVHLAPAETHKGTSHPSPRHNSTNHSSPRHNSTNHSSPRHNGTLVQGWLDEKVYEFSKGGALLTRERVHLDPARNCQHVNV